MTTRLLTGTYVSGYHITPPVTIVSIATTGYVEGTGVTTPTAATGAYTVVNEGKVASSGAGIYLYTGGSITNGASTDTTASISGTVGVVVGADAGTVVNFATISASRAASQGVILAHGGSVTNGSASDTQALVQGAEAVGVYLTAGTVRNFGTLQGGAMAPEGGAVYLGGGGSVINGSASDTTALIGGSLTLGSVDGVVTKNVAATVINYGDIVGASAGTVNYVYYTSTAILLKAGGTVTNGASGASSAYIVITHVPVGAWIRAGWEWAFRRV
ncbi:MAG TPA: hypothetical protein VFC47_16155 [Caulobacteraceae bacterium]|nr:hypothetical protein [Caulobacteraceae bacterium]